MIGSIGRWHGEMALSDLKKQRNEAERTVTRLKTEIQDRRELLAAHKAHVAQLDREIAHREALHA